MPPENPNPTKKETKENINKHFLIKKSKENRSFVMKCTKLTIPTFQQHNFRNLLKKNQKNQVLHTSKFTKRHKKNK